MEQQWEPEGQGVTGKERCRGRERSGWGVGGGGVDGELEEETGGWEQREEGREGAVGGVPRGLVGGNARGLRKLRTPKESSKRGWDRRMGGSRCTAGGGEEHPAGGSRGGG